MNSNLNLAQPFIILMVRHWNGWDAMNFLNQSINTQSWYEKWNTGQANFSPNRYPKHNVVIIMKPRSQSQPIPTIHCTYKVRWKGSSCCVLTESARIQSILVWKDRNLLPKLSPLATQKPVCGDGYRWCIQISALHNHSLYLWWDIGMVGMLWIAWISP